MPLPFVSKRLFTIEIDSQKLKLGTIVAMRFLVILIIANLWTELMVKFATRLPL
jgi:hypothetical protein